MYSARRRYYLRKWRKKAYIRKYKMEKGVKSVVITNYLKRWNLTILTEQRKTLRCQKDICIHGTKIHKELENCIVLCSNCHRKKTTEEKDYLETDYVEPEEIQYDLFGGED